LNLFVAEERASWDPGAWRDGTAPCNGFCAHLAQATGPLLRDRGSDLLLPPPGPLGIRLGADGPTGMRTGGLRPAGRKGWLRVLSSALPTVE
jgi:hypothetical protein